MDIKTKLITTFLILMVLMLLMGGTSIYTTSSLNSANNAQLEKAAEKSLVLDYEKHIKQVIQTSADLIIDHESGEVSEKMDKALHDDFAFLKEKGPQILEIAETPDEKASANYLIKIVDQLETVVMSMLYDLVKDHADMDEFASMHDAIVGATGDLDTRIGVIIESIQKKVDHTKAEMDSTEKKSQTASVVMMAIVVSLSILALIFSLKTILGPVNKMTEVTKDLAEGDGDLTKRVNSRTHDEMKKLGDHINQFIENVHNIIVAVGEQSQSLTSASSELAATTEELSSTFNEQAAQVTEVASAMEEMSSSSTEVLNSVDSSLATAEQATQKTREGIQILNKAVVDMNEIKNNIGGLSDIIKQLSQSSTQIGDILNVIDDIADQTNLLALNAAIEAARAGEHGRGFAVVADEVRKLAERTQKATGEVEVIIKTLQDDSNKASSNMDKALVSVNRGSDVINQTSRIFGEVSEAIENVNSNNSLVGAAVREESSTIASVNDNIQVIASALEQSSRAVTEVAGTVANLQELALQQDGMIRRFRI